MDEYPPSQALWPDRDQGPWYLRLHWGRVSGRRECVGLEIRSVRTGDDEGSGSLLARGAPMEPHVLTTKVLRELPLGRIVKETRESVSGLHFQWAAREPTRREELLRKAEDWLQEAHHSTRGGRPRLPASHYAEVAQVYETAIKEGEDPMEAVRTWQWPHGQVSRSTAWRWVKTCKEMGLRDEGDNHA